LVKQGARSLLACGDSARAFNAFKAASFHCVYQEKKKTDDAAVMHVLHAL